MAGAGVVRRGDPNSGGGLAISGVRSVRVNGRPVVVPFTPVTPHPCCGGPGLCIIHCAAVTTIGSSRVRAEGKPIVYKGSPDTCAHTRLIASTDVNVGY